MSDKQAFAERIRRISAAAPRPAPQVPDRTGRSKSRLVMPVMALLSMAGGTVFAWEMMEYKARTAPNAPAQSAGMTLAD
tara:strand:+ start:277 stop:513 length:237 start_codon:yes stop_codon:yes gene_type:complete